MLYEHPIEIWNKLLNDDKQRVVLSQTLCKKIK